MPTTVVWEGHNIEFSTRLSPKSLFFTFGTTVKLDGNEVARAGTGSLAFTENAIATFEHSGKNVQLDVEIRSSIFTLTTCDYLVRIEGIVISQGKQAIENIGLGCLSWFLISIIIALFLLRLFL